MKNRRNKFGRQPIRSAISSLYEMLETCKVESKEKQWSMLTTLSLVTAQLQEITATVFEKNETTRIKSISCESLSRSLLID